MKKSERINLIMRYINNRSRFTIAELQKEFDISRATAIRDVQDIEAMGLPLVAERGRGGGYFVMQNDFLPTVRFTSDELKAVFIAFMATKNQQLPYLHGRKTIMEKLIAIAPQTQQDILIMLNQLLLFTGSNPAHPDILELDDAGPPEFNQLLNLALNDRYMTLTYEPVTGRTEQLNAYILQVFQMQGTWLLDLYDLDTTAFRYLPIEQLRESRSLVGNPPLSEKEILVQRQQLRVHGNLKVTLNKRAVERFKAFHPPGLILQFTGMFQSSGLFQTQINESDEEEVEYYADWLLYLGLGAKIESMPQALKVALKGRQENLKALLGYRSGN
ncbi:helix-turn-helix transcriptional regulator [Lactococcus ileimucosae]|uniref:helix-turn-helix transcriptional regulator n=1 Tax=Lactococcus ileimucosae TaxID=2941329 RepID=UPI00204398DA|nr:HTH domain-containing protein [Lactococcus ileimucosae]